MATSTKRTRLGNYICKANDYDIRMLYSYTRNLKTKKNVVNGHDMRICRGNKVIKDGFKTKDDAVAYANKL